MRTRQGLAGGKVLCLTASLALFAVLAAIIALGIGEEFDASVRAGINRVAAPHLTFLAQSLSLMGSVAFVFTLAAVTAIVFVIRGNTHAALRLAVVMSTAAVLNPVVKLVFARPRPEAFFGRAPETFSFVSGHALFSACFYGFVAGIIGAYVQGRWQRRILFTSGCLLVVAIGLSRVYLGVHYLTDVIAGFALAATILCAVNGGSVRTDHRQPYA